MPIDTRHPREIRADIRSGKLSGVTAGLGPGFVQANMTDADVDRFVETFGRVVAKDS